MSHHDFFFEVYELVSMLIAMIDGPFISSKLVRPAARQRSVQNHSKTERGIVSVPPRRACVPPSIVVEVEVPSA